MRYLVTGAAGFIGSNFVKMIFEKEPHAEVINIDNMKMGSSLNNTLDFANEIGYKHVKGNISQINQIRHKQPDYVINFAAESHVDRAIDSSLAFTESNTMGMHTLLDYAHRRKIPFLQISTDEVYGDVAVGESTEESRLLPGNPYAASKAAADLIALSYFKTYGMNVKITRCSNNYGPNQYPEKLIPLFIKKLMNNEKVPIYGDGQQIREWIHVKDHCEAIWKVLKEGTPGEIYNIGSGDAKTNLQITETLLKAFGMGPEMVLHVEDRLGHDLRYAINCDKLKALGWAPTISFEDGMAQTIEAYKKRGFGDW